MDNSKLLKKLKWQFWLLGKLKIPLIGYTRVRLLDINDEVSKAKIKLRRRTKNHLNSMYFGALAIGADVATGIHVFYFAEKHNVNVSFAFKGCNSEFIMRAESDCIFVARNGKMIEKMILESKKSGDRMNKNSRVDVFNETNDLVATFDMVLSVKCK